ncbi:MAG: sarcosine oxidase subunit alpha family protein [Aestuariivita sp.]|nr:sarcosine oxidase subunit alpha family protein [Aestuariivita sp.]
MNKRIDRVGRLIDKSKILRFSFDGVSYAGYSGDTLASALLANDQMFVARSFKYHRPRGIVAAGPEEPNALVGLAQGSYFEPNQRATTTELFDGLTAVSQNHWPTLNFDIGAINSMLASFLPSGFYYKMFIHPRSFWKYIYEPLLRKAAGLGKSPVDRDPDCYEYFYYHTDVLVVGGGISGLQAAKRAAESGARVFVVEQGTYWGGRSLVDHAEFKLTDHLTTEDVIDQFVKQLSGMSNVVIRTRMMASGVYDHGYVLIYERISDHHPTLGGPRHRLWRVRARQVIFATGAIERPLVFAGNDIPGVMLASSVRDYLMNYGVACGNRILVVTNNDSAYLTAIQLKKFGVDITRIIDIREPSTSALIETAKANEIEIHFGKAICQVKGKKRVRGVELCDSTGRADLEYVACDTVAMSGGWTPTAHLWSHCGGKLFWDEQKAMFRPDNARPPIGASGKRLAFCIGAANGEMSLSKALLHAQEIGSLASGEGGEGKKTNIIHYKEEESETPILPIWKIPSNAGFNLQNKSWVDFQNDVKVTDIQLSAREGYESIEHTKRYTTLGMATDQGKLSNVNGLALLADALHEPIANVGTTTFRPPYSPISIGSIAGEARADLFQPIRQSPIYEWHSNHGADWEPVGQWHRPYAYLRKGETVFDAVNREVINTRQNVGLFDASSLGKLMIKGPDAGKFLDKMYTNMMSTLKPGKCRYGLMCSENGFLIDDGVVARINEDTFLCHTTTGGADNIHAHMEEWLQTEWWDLKVYVTNLTEQFAQITVAGPKSRMLLEKLDDIDLGGEKLPFMSWIDGFLNGLSVRVFRISFSGELSFEISINSANGLRIWEILMDVGREFDIMSYGTEALHVMRAEKGFIVIGDETDGTVTPQDLNLDWAISQKKTDFIGKRAQERTHFKDPDRWSLVGLQTLDGSVLPDGIYAVEPQNTLIAESEMIGRVTSTYYSPTLQIGIALGLIKRGKDRLGEVIEFAGLNKRTYKARIVSPVFFDPDGEKQNV